MLFEMIHESKTELLGKLWTRYDFFLVNYNKEYSRLWSNSSILSEIVEEYL